ncbi:exo-beta-N-acetylmuramidase NamZ domain-containing protein [Capnocytophaga canimorsus]|uniref:exo-beta-N-acetylmuramidase NamZ family protein n=1 Tax=Capnocytophaga canimorsus TaxID=28188 RepID=UPI00384BA182
MKYSKFNVSRFLIKPKITFFCLLLMVSCKNNGQNQQKNTSVANTPTPSELILGANRMELYLSELKNKNIAIVTNQTGVVKTQLGTYTHLVDTLLQHKINIVKVFAPEHGFRGNADAGEIIKDGKDTKTGISIISLYGKDKKPSVAHLKGIDLVLFDLQDVGVRFYTYISTLHYVMEACAEQNIPIWVLDRPNPNGHYVDGPVLKPSQKSFVGMHPVPIVYGMTIGEYAQMINGEGWLSKAIKAPLRVIPLALYQREQAYDLPVRPSPNLPNAVAINLYPSLCLFEGTHISVGRGTEMQFQIYGAPYLNKTNFSFVPAPNVGDKKPLYQGQVCYGEDLSATPRQSKLNLIWLQKAHAESVGVKTVFFNSFFDKLAGTPELKEQIVNKMTEDEIRKTWQKDLNKFLKIRKKYLIYIEK